MAPDPRIAVCPGSYDPITNGHLDVIARASQLFDAVVVGVVNHPVRKGKTLFDTEERLGFIVEATGPLGNVRAEAFDVLVVEFARRLGARAIVKGLRAISDFEYEMEMNQLNRREAPDVDTLYLMASPQYSFLSSSGVKELAIFDGSIEDLVPEAVARRLKEQLPRKRTSPCHGRPGPHRQTRRSRSQRQARPADGPGARGQGGDLRHPRPDARDDPCGDQAGALDRQGASGDARRGQARGGADRQGGARAPVPADLRAGGHQAGRARRRGHHRGRPRP